MYFNELNKYTAFYSIFTAYILMWIDILFFLLREDPSFGSFSDKISPLRLFRALSMANLLNNLIMTRILAAITLLLSIVLTILVTIFCSVPIILAGL
jgi:hypothetical protein